MPVIGSRVVAALSSLFWSLWRCFPSSIRLAVYDHLQNYGDGSYGHRIRMLPFGFVLKSGWGTPFIEVDNIRFIAAHTSIPVPLILDAVEYSVPSREGPVPAGYILMTRIEGQRLDRWVADRALRPPGQRELLEQLDHYLRIDDTQGIEDTMEKLKPTAMPTLDMSDADALVQDLRGAFEQLRSLAPLSPSVSGLSNRPLRCNRGGDSELIGPFANQQEFKNYLFARANGERSDILRRLAEPVNAKMHRVCFTHADIAARNILIRDGRLVGIIDWEFAGWYPEYWEYTAMEAQLRLEKIMRQFWDVVQPFGPGDPYSDELALERALCSPSVRVPYEDDEQVNPRDLGCDNARGPH
ncbi:kinase-like protein [Pilatotrama ljubarskyi]|nr:kinase-like protein [Pilatotrama ljubarskyi]